MWQNVSGRVQFGGGGEDASCKCSTSPVAVRRSGDIVARKMSTVQITLNRAGVAAPVQLAAIASSDVIAAGLTAFAADTLAKPTMPDQFPELQIGQGSPRRCSQHGRCNAAEEVGNPSPSF